MKNLKFRYASAKNFMCFGEEGIELFFEDYGNVILVKGLNLDTGTEVDPASNGAGKSTLQDIISYAIYGKTVKHPKKLKHGKVINAINKKKLEVEIQFDSVRIVRSREPDKLHIWESKDHIWDDKTKVSKTVTETQKWIEEKIGLSHNAFCNVVVFDDSNQYCFLEQDTEGKRTIVENLLGLDRCREYLDNTKDLLKEQKSIVKSFKDEYDSLENLVLMQKQNINKINQQEADWKNDRTKQINLVEMRIESKVKELSTTSTGEALLEYNKVQDQIIALNISIPDLEAKREKVIGLQKESKLNHEVKLAQRNEFLAKIQLLENELSKKKSEMHSSQKLLLQLGNLEEGQSCPTCHGLISKENYGSVIEHENCLVNSVSEEINNHNKLISENKVQSATLLDELKALEATYSNYDKMLQKLDTMLLQSRNQISSLSKIKPPDSASKEQVLEAEIVELKLQLSSKKEELNKSPYVEIMKLALEHLAEHQKKRDDKVASLKLAESEIPYYEYWVEAFGDKGIRKDVVDNIIPILNSRVSYWLQYLIGEKIQLSFDNELNETIFRNEVEVDYHAMSMGEKRRVNLAVSQAFSYVMVFNSGSCPSLVFLDEITGGGIDKSGVVGVFNMIMELAKERQIFVTTHNQNLLDLLNGCESILLVKKNDITKLAS